MSSGEIFVIFVIPALGVILAYAAVRANEWAVRRARGRGEQVAVDRHGVPLYFAYGANMDPAAMALRCPASRPVGPGRLARHRFIVMREGYASVVRDPARAVHGVLWDLALDDIPGLDRFEGLAGGLYAKASLPVAGPGGVRRALIYLGRSAAPGRPRPGYLDAVLVGARAARLPPAYVREIAGWARGAPS